MEPRSITRTDWLLIAGLFALILPLRVWLLCNTEVTARDSIGYIRYALQFEQVDESTGERVSYASVLKKNHQHPGYPLLVLAMSQPLRAWDGDAVTPENMELSTQLVNLLASLMLILPMYFLGRQFFDRTVSFGGTLLYQYLPISAQHLSDGISEPVYLLLLVSGLLQLVHAVRERSVWRGMLCGLFAGLAYLTRPEGALIMPTFGVVLIALQFRESWRCTWRQCLGCLSAGAVTAALVGSPYYVATGQFSNKPNINNITHAEAPGASPSPILFAATVARPGHAHGSAGLLTRSVWALGVELNQGFHYVAGVPAVLGFLWSFTRLRRDLAFWALLLFAGLHSLILIRLGMIANYISDRHVMILVIGGAYFAVEGMRQLPNRLLARAPSQARFAPLVFGLLFVALIAFCLPKATQRLHGNRLANHQAGLWLAHELKDGDHIEDDHAWSHFFAGGVFREAARSPVLPKDHVPTTWIVTTRSHDAEIAEQQGQAASARTPVKWWPASSDLQHARVVIYSQPRDFEKNPWKR